MKRIYRLTSLLILLFTFASLSLNAETARTDVVKFISSNETVSDDNIINTDYRKYTVFITSSPEVVFNNSLLIRKTNDTAISKKASVYSDGGSIYLNGSVLYNDAPGAPLVSLSSKSSLYSSGTLMYSETESSPGIIINGGAKVQSFGDIITTTGGSSPAVNIEDELSEVYLNGTTVSTEGKGPSLINSGSLFINDSTVSSANSSAVVFSGSKDLKIYGSNISSKVTGDSEYNSGIFITGDGAKTENTNSITIADSNLVTENSPVFGLSDANTEIILKSSKTLTSVGIENFLIADNSNLKLFADSQNLDGNISANNGSSVEVYCNNKSSFKGSITGDNSTVRILISGNSSWTVTDSCNIDYLINLGTITDLNGDQVKITDKDGKTIKDGISDITITVREYSEEDTELNYSIPDRSYYEQEKPAPLTAEKLSPDNVSELKERIDTAYTADKEKNESEEKAEETTPDISEAINEFGVGGNKTAVIIILVMEAITILIIVLYYASKGKLIKKKDKIEKKK